MLEMLQAGGVRGPGDTTADGLFKDTTMPAVGPGDLAQFGDLVFFGPNGKAGHVGFMLDDRLMLEAGGGQSSTVTVQDAANAGAYVRVRPVSRRKDLLGYRRPAWA